MIGSTDVDCCNTTIRNKNLYKCKTCNKKLCGQHSYSYVDESNRSITNNSPILCKDCYKITYETTNNTTRNF